MRLEKGDLRPCFGEELLRRMPALLPVYRLLLRPRRTQMLYVKKHRSPVGDAVHVSLL
jgi:hypothetical protein